MFKVALCLANTRLKNKTMYVVLASLYDKKNGVILILRDIIKGESVLSNNKTLTFP